MPRRPRRPRTRRRPPSDLCVGACGPWCGRERAPRETRASECARHESEIQGWGEGRRELARCPRRAGDEARARGLRALAGAPLRGAACGQCAAHAHSEAEARARSTRAVVSSVGIYIYRVRKRSLGRCRRVGALSSALGFRGLNLDARELPDCGGQFLIHSKACFISQQSAVTAGVSF